MVFQVQEKTKYVPKQVRDNSNRISQTLSVFDEFKRMQKVFRVLDGSK